MPRSTWKCSAKLAPAMIMNSTITISMAALSKPAMLALRVENPPVAMVAKAWLTASSGAMPRAIRRGRLETR